MLSQNRRAARAVSRSKPGVRSDGADRGTLVGLSPRDRPTPVFAARE